MAGNGRPRKLLPGAAAVLDVLSRYDAGELTADIARCHNVPLWVIRRCLNEHGVQMDRRHGPRSPSEATIAKYAHGKALYDNGMTLEQVGVRLGVSPQAVHKAFKRLEKELANA